VPSVLTAYLPGSPHADDWDEARLAECARDDIANAFSADPTMCSAIERAPWDVSIFETAMGAPAPGQLTEARGTLPLRAAPDIRASEVLKSNRPGHPSG
jgi:hypothetical protein